MAISRSERVVTGCVVHRDETGTVCLIDGDSEIVLSVDDIRQLLAFAVDGTEPPKTAEELAAEEKGRKFAEFLDSLLLKPE